MMAVRCSFTEKEAHIWVDNQHLSRLTHAEVREIVLQCILFGRSKLLKEVKAWITGDSLEKMDKFMSHEEKKELNG